MDPLKEQIRECNMIIRVLTLIWTYILSCETIMINFQQYMTFIVYRATDEDDMYIQFDL